MNQRKYGALLSYINIFVKNGVNFIYVPFLLKYVGQSEYGLFQMTNSTILSLSLLSLGFSSAYVKFYMNFKYTENQEENERKINKLNGFYLILFTCISLLSLVIGIILVMNTQNIFGKNLSNTEVELTKKLMFILVINISLTFPSSMFDSFILVNEKFVFQQVRQILQSLLIPLIAVPFIIFGFGVISVVLVQTLITCIFLFLNIHYCLQKLNMRFEFKNIPKSYMKEIGIFSFFIFLNQIVDMINNNAPNFILGIMLGSKEVATFAIALQIKNVFFMLSLSLSNIFIPTVNRLVSKNEPKEKMTELMIKIGRLQMIILFFILGGFIVVGKYFILSWAGKSNYLAYKLVILMVLPSITPLCQNVGIEIQRAYNKHIFRSIVYSVFALLNIFITIVGTKYFGLIGASFGYVLSLIFANGFLMNWYYHKKLNLNMVKYWKETLPNIFPFMLTVSMLLYLQKYIKVDSLGLFVLFAVVYSILYFLIYILFVINKEEKELLYKRIK